MRARLRATWDDLTDSLWLVPALCTLVAVGLALGLVALDQRVTLDDRASRSPWLFGGGAAGARGVLSAIAASMLGVAGTVFSITIVALQLASSQFTPRVLRHFTGDRGNQLVLGVFIGTFTYALLVLRSVHSQDEDRVRFVPIISVSVAVALALVAIGMLIYQIDHVASSIQAAVIVDRATSETVEVMRSVAAGPAGEAIRPPVPVPDGDATWVTAVDGGYVTAVDTDRLLDWATEHRAAVTVSLAVGTFVSPRQPIVGVRPARRLSEADEEELRGAVLTRLERTLRSDPAFGIRQVADIALRALSPGINDPTTATMCIDRLGELLIVAAAEGGSFGERTVARGDGRVEVTGQSFDRLVEEAFAQIRHYGSGDATAITHLVTTLGTVAGLVDPPFAAPVANQARLAVEAARGSISIPADLDRVIRAADWTAGVVAVRGRTSSSL